MEGAWLDWVRRLQAIAQNGLHYSSDPFERERFEEVRALAAELAALGGEEPEALAAAFELQAGHATPKIDVRAAAFHDGSVLLVRNRDDGLWSLPGGWMEVGELPSRAAEKELHQESGYTGRAVKLVGVYEHDLRARTRWPFHAITLVLLCELESSAVGAIDVAEIIEVEFFAEDQLPPFSVRASADQLAAAFAHERDRSLPTAFD